MFFDGVNIHASKPGEILSSMLSQDHSLIQQLLKSQDAKDLPKLLLPFG
jgi:hypothetical protein